MCLRQVEFGGIMQIRLIKLINQNNWASKAGNFNLEKKPRLITYKQNQLIIYNYLFISYHIKERQHYLNISLCRWNYQTWSWLSQNWIEVLKENSHWYLHLGKNTSLIQIVMIIFNFQVKRTDLPLGCNNCDKYH